MKLSKLILVVILKSLILLGCNDEQSRQMTNDLMNTFAKSCNSYGRWSSQSDMYARALIQSFENLKSNGKCDATQLGATFKVIQDLTSQIHNVYSNPYYAEYRQTQEELQELTLASSKTEDADLIELLRDEILTRQVSLATLRGQKSAEGNVSNKIGYQDQYSIYGQELSSMFSSLFMQTESLSSCFENSPAAKVQLVSSVMAAAGSFISPVVGTNMHILSGAMTSTVQYLENQKISKAIKEIETNRFATAFSCAMETMTNFYCSAEDAVEILKLKNQHRTPPDEVSELWRGLSMVNEFLPVLNDWLLKIKAGAPPQRRIDAGQKNRVLFKNNVYETGSIEVVALFNEYDRRISRASNSLKKELKVNMVEDFAHIILPCEDCSYSSPFMDFRNQRYQYACYLVLGIGSDSHCHYNSQEDTQLKPYIQKIIEDNQPDFDMAIARANWRTVQNRVRELIDLEFDEYIFDNPKVLMVAATEETFKDVSPRETLDEFTDYLTDIRVRAISENSKIVLLIDESLQEIEDVKTIIDEHEQYYLQRERCINEGKLVTESDSESETEDEVCMSSENPLRRIYNSFKLDRGEQYFNEKLFMIVDWDVRTRIQNNEVPDDIRDIIIDASGEINRRLTSSGYENSNRILDDLNVARIQSKDMIKTFTSFASAAASDLIKLLDEKSKLEQEGDDVFERPYAQQVGKLCTFLYVSKVAWPNNEVRDICRNALVMSPESDHYPDLKIVVGELDDSLTRIKSPTKRSRARRCVYYNYLRANRLVEVINPNESAKTDRISLPIGKLLSQLYQR